MPGIFLEPLGPERQLPGLDAAGVEIAGFLDGPGLLGQEIVGIGAERRDSQRLAGKRDARARSGAVPSVVHDVLCLGDRVIAALTGNCRQIALHCSAVRQRTVGRLSDHADVGRAE